MIIILSSHADAEVDAMNPGWLLVDSSRKHAFLHCVADTCQIFRAHVHAAPGFVSGDTQVTALFSLAGTLVFWKCREYIAGGQTLHGLLLKRARGDTRLARHWMTDLYKMMQERAPRGFVCRLSHQLFQDPGILVQTGQTCVTRLWLEHQLQGLEIMVCYDC